MGKSDRFSFHAALLLVFCYVAFAVLAFHRYTLPYSPLRNWLSDLGNPVQNPHGAAFYNVGILSTAFLLVVFFLGLSSRIEKSQRSHTVLLRLAQVFGIVGSFCMMMSALFPIDRIEIHAFWSTSLYVMLSTAFVFLAVVLRRCQKSPMWILVLGVSTAVMVILTGVYPATYVLEWITVVLFLVYVVAVGVETKRWPSR